MKRTLRTKIAAVALGLFAIVTAVSGGTASAGDVEPQPEPSSAEAKPAPGGGGTQSSYRWK